MRELIGAMTSSNNSFQALETARIRLSEDFFKFSKQRDIYYQLSFLSKYGKEIVKVKRDNGQSKIITELEDKKGRYYVNKTLVLNRDEVMVSNIDLNRSNGEIEEPNHAVIRYGTPIFDKFNRLQGIIIFSVSANKFLNILDGSDNKDETLLMVDSDGYYLFNSDEKKLWGSSRDKNTGERLQKDLPLLGNKIIGLKTPTTFYDGDNIINVKLVGNGVDSYSNLGYMISYLPKDSIFYPSIKAREFYIIFTFITLVLTIFFALIIAKKITRPIANLTKAAYDMSKGDIEKPVEIEGNDEVNNLALSLERLRRSVKILMAKYTS
jgi:HAMP domain-containing protein